MDKWPSLKPFVIGEDDNPYLLRWYIIPRNRWFNIYLHHFRRSDDDRALHDHPWVNLSILLSGPYLEHTLSGAVKLREPWRPWAFWRVTFRRAVNAHRIELIDGKPVWTLFLTGPKQRTWGFLCPKGWIPWTDFVEATEDGNKLGKGCP